MYVLPMSWDITLSRRVRHGRKSDSNRRRTLSIEIHIVHSFNIIQFGTPKGIEKSVYTAADTRETGFLIYWLYQNISGVDIVPYGSYIFVPSFSMQSITLYNPHSIDSSAFQALLHLLEGRDSGGLFPIPSSSSFFIDFRHSRRVQ